LVNILAEKFIVKELRLELELTYPNWFKDTDEVKTHIFKLELLILITLLIICLYPQYVILLATGNVTFHGQTYHYLLMLLLSINFLHFYLVCMYRWPISHLNTLLYVGDVWVDWVSSTWHWFKVTG
jgi:hypothetical protein